jgi:hypothetical protein
MKKNTLLFLVVMFLVCLFIPAPAAAQYNQSGNIITCESRHHRIQYCPLSDPRSIVVLVQQVGNERCVRGETWGNDGRGIWVDRGCKAQFRVDPPGSGPGWWSSGPGQRAYGRPKSGACFYKNTDFRGEYFCRERGAHLPQVPLDDEISSIQIYGRVTITIYKDPNFSGPQAATRESVPDLHRWRMPNNPNLNWDNRISSARLD